MGEASKGTIILSLEKYCCEFSYMNNHDTNIRSVILRTIVAMLYVGDLAAHEYFLEKKTKHLITGQMAFNYKIL